MMHEQFLFSAYAIIFMALFFFVRMIFKPDEQIKSLTLFSIFVYALIALLSGYTFQSKIICYAALLAIPLTGLAYFLYFLSNAKSEEKKIKNKDGEKS